MSGLLRSVLLLLFDLIDDVLSLWLSLTKLSLVNIAILWVSLDILLMHLIFLKLEFLWLCDLNVVRMALGRLSLGLSRLLRLLLLLFHAVEKIKLSVSLWLLGHPWSPHKPVTNVLVLNILLWDVLLVLNWLTRWMDCEVVVRRKVLETVFDQGKVVNPEKAITLEQLCLLLVLAHKILGIIVLSVYPRLH